MKLPKLYFFPNFRDFFLTEKPVPSNRSTVTNDLSNSRSSKSSHLNIVPAATDILEQIFYTSGSSDFFKIQNKGQIGGIELLMVMQ